MMVSGGSVGMYYYSRTSVSYCPKFVTGTRLTICVFLRDCIVGAEASD